MVTKADFIRQADAICGRAKAKQEIGLEKTIVAIQTGDKVSQKTLVLKYGLPPLEAEVKALRKLTPPSNGGGEATRIIRGIERAIAQGKKDPLLMLKQTGNPLMAVAPEARQYGFTVCGQV